MRIKQGLSLLLNPNNMIFKSLIFICLFILSREGVTAQQKCDLPIGRNKGITYLEGLLAAPELVRALVLTYAPTR
jgi:hypothetical protein